MFDNRTSGILHRYNKDYYGGGLMFLLGTGTIYKGLGYDVGTLARMGPGYFPVVIGAVLAVIGILIALSARSDAGPTSSESKSHGPEWRGWAAIILSNIAFVVIGHYGGLLPATFAVVFIAALGDRQNTLKSAFILAAAMVVVCLIIFSWALHLQFPLFRWG